MDDDVPAKNPELGSCGPLSLNLFSFINHTRNSSGVVIKSHIGIDSTELKLVKFHVEIRGFSC